MKEHVCITSLVILSLIDLYKKDGKESIMLELLSARDFKDFYLAINGLVNDDTIVTDITGQNAMIFKTPVFRIVIIDKKVRNKDIYEDVNNCGLNSGLRTRFGNVKFVRDNYSSELMGPDRKPLHPVIQDLIYVMHNISRMREDRKKSVFVPAIFVKLSSDERQFVRNLRKNDFYDYVIRMIPDSDNDDYRELTFCSITSPNVQDFLNAIISEYSVSEDGVERIESDTKVDHVNTQSEEDSDLVTISDNNNDVNTRKNNVSKSIKRSKYDDLDEIASVLRENLCLSQITSPNNNTKSGQLISTASSGTSKSSKTQAIVGKGQKGRDAIKRMSEMRKTSGNKRNN